MKNVIIIALALCLVGVLYWKFSIPTAQAPKEVGTKPGKVKYRYAPNNFEFSYPENYQFTDPVYKGLEEGVVQIGVGKDAYPGTNLNDSAFVISKHTAISETECLQLGGNYNFDLHEVVNGILFNKAESSDSGAGNFYEIKIYRTYNNLDCLELRTVLHTTNIGNYEPGTISEVNNSLVWSQLDEIVKSFKFNF